MCRDSIYMCVSAFLSNQLFILISVFALSPSMLFFFLSEPFIPSYFQCISYKNRDALLYNPKTTVTHKKVDTDSMSNIRPIFIFFQMSCNCLGFKILLAAACNKTSSFTQDCRFLHPSLIQSTSHALPFWGAEEGNFHGLTFLS